MKSSGWDVNYEGHPDVPWLFTGHDSHGEWVAFLFTSIWGPKIPWQEKFLQLQVN